MRAIANGWKNIQALDTFIWHKGSVSFGIDQQPLHVQKASEVIDRLHSNYHSLIQQFVTKDPAGVYRTEVDLKRIQNSANPTVLMISHQLGGGTEHHCRELIRLYPEVNWLIIMPEVNGHVILQNSWAKGAVALRYHLLSEWDDLVLLLKALNVTRIHWHHRLGFPSEICNLAESLEVPQDVTLHDFYSICPQISLLGVDGCYCGEKGESQCMICLQKNSVAYSDNISKWRSQNYDWLRKCERIITPSYDSKNRIQHYFPDLEILSIPHPEKRQFHEAIWVKPANDEKLRVAVIGALSFEKGAVILEKTALLVDKKRLQISFKLFGYAYRALFDSCCLQVTGPYKEKDLPDMLAEWKPHIVWFPTQIPETYSYTLSTSMALGLPVVCTDIGAQAERLKGRQFSWLMPLNTTPEQWCSWFDAVREQEGVPEAGGSVKRKRVSPYFTQDEMSFYNRFYVVRNQKVLISTLPETWQSHSLGQDKPVSYRNHLISFLYWLRRQMLFRSITSKIPPTVQRRVKSFLLGER
jgi:glycosyltransferase involved in cell wall biosynthesis